MSGLMSLLADSLAGWSMLSGMVVAGAALCVAAAIALLAGALRPAWFSAAGAGAAGSPGFALASGALDGLPLGLVGGLLGGFAFEYLQSLLGVIRFTFASGVSVGLALGGVCGALGAFALARLSRRSAALALGALVGLVVGLGAFLIAFGTTAGFGPETDLGVGPEVGALLATAGALLGALAVSLMRAGPAGGDTTGAGRHTVGRNTAAGAGVGALCGLALSAANWLSSEVAFILPGVAPAYATSVGALTGRLYGLALLVTLGALVGALAGALGASSRWRGVSLAIALTLGLLFGLTLGLSHADVGGPLIFAQRMSYDPMGSLYGLVGGLLIGALVGVGCTLALRWAEREPGRRTLLVAIALFALGVTLLLTPMWFHPLFGVDIP